MTAMAAAPQAAASATRVRLRRRDGNAPIVRSSLLYSSQRLARVIVSPGDETPRSPWRVDPPIARAMVTGYTSIMTDSEQGTGQQKATFVSQFKQHYSACSRAMRIGRNLDSVSASSAAGSEPDDDAAAGEQARPVPAKLRAAQARCPTRRCRRRRSSRPGPRTAPGPCTRARGSPRRRRRSACRRRRPSGAPRRQARARSAPRPGCRAPGCPRCWTLGSRISSGRGATYMAVQSGDRVSRSETAAYSCSSFSFADPSRIAGEVAVLRLGRAARRGAGQHQGAHLPAGPCG